LTVGFGAAVAMWAVGYVARLPALSLPAPAVLPALVACVIGGGVLLGRQGGRGPAQGAAAGALTGVLNLLVLGGVLAHSETRRPSALAWVPLSVLLAAGLGAAGAALGARRARRPPFAGWSGALVHVALAAALLLLGVGGLVTSTGAGLAVVDWPKSYGYNMFLYPLSRMTGGVYYEHAHRLFGSLVGLVTLAVALHLSRFESRRSVRALAWAAFALVVVQGLLGGLRVTGHLTLSSSAAEMRPNLVLAAVHGVCGQLFFGVLVVLACLTAESWRRADAPAVRPGARADRWLGGSLIALVVAQLVLGAMQRHFGALLMAHIGVGVALVAPLAVHVGFRAWGRNPGSPALRRLGLGLVGAVGLQLALGLAAFAVSGPAWQQAPAAVAITTAHQWFGAILLGAAVALQCWVFRLLAPPGRAAGARG